MQDRLSLLVLRIDLVADYEIAEIAPTISCVNNISGIAQIGSGHTAVAEQDGSNNISGIIQIGRNQNTQTRQVGDGNVSLVIQGGY